MFSWNLFIIFLAFFNSVSGFLLRLITVVLCWFNSNFLRIYNSCSPITSAFYSLFLYFLLILFSFPYILLSISCSLLFLIFVLKGLSVYYGSFGWMSVFKSYCFFSITFLYLMFRVRPVIIWFASLTIVYSSIVFVIGYSR